MVQLEMHTVSVLVEKLLERALSAGRLMQLNHKAGHFDICDEKIAGNRLSAIGIVFVSLKMPFLDRRDLDTEKIRPAFGSGFDVSDDDIDLGKALLIYVGIHNLSFL